MLTRNQLILDGPQAFLPNDLDFDTNPELNIEHRSIFHLSAFPSMIARHTLHCQWKGYISPFTIQIIGKLQLFRPQRSTKFNQSYW